MALQADRESVSTLADLVDRILDKGLVINADITVSVVGVQLLGIKIRATLASFETAARYGLEFPSGTRLEVPAWREAAVIKETCPRCAKRMPVEELLGEGCSWCGWVSARARLASPYPVEEVH
ncbi:MAG: gas vesicle protein [Chloroflexi bacterium]|nr:gas vesicle protein [Chloroflexota bacterium]